MPLSIRKFPRAILHIDGDSFFASCEMARRPDLRGRAVVTGEERGIATAMSTEAKRLGITRGMPVHQIRRDFPSVVILKSDYESYAMYSKRMTEIVRRYTPDVEEYSIDECFADLTGLRRSLRMSYPDIAQAIKHDLQTELGMTFSVGLSLTKVLAKTASKHKKPDGLTCIPGYRIEEYLASTPAKSIWGIGPNTAVYLEKLGIRTALELAKKDLSFVETYLTKPTIELWRELRGESVLKLETSKKTEYKSIMKTRTFTPPSGDRSVLLGELSRNIESACTRLRHYGLYAKEINFYIKGQDFRHYGTEIEMGVAGCMPEKFLEAVQNNFDKIYKPGKIYRATGVTFGNISARQLVTGDLFGAFAASEDVKRIYDEIDALSEKFGRVVVSLGSSMSRTGSQVLHERRLVHRTLPLPLLGKVH